VKFFLPAADSPEQAESVYGSIRSFAEEQTGWKTTDRRIYRLEYRHEGKNYSAQVGEFDPRIDEVVIAILETVRGVYLVCSQNRCVLRGEPMLVGSDEVYIRLDFDDQADQPSSAIPGVH
jgi:hypothetical protein